MELVKPAMSPIEGARRIEVLQGALAGIKRGLHASSSADDVRDIAGQVRDFADDCVTALRQIAEDIEAGKPVITAPFDGVEDPVLIQFVDSSDD